MIKEKERKKKKKLFLGLLFVVKTVPDLKKKEKG